MYGNGLQWELRYNDRGWLLVKKALHPLRRVNTGGEARSRSRGTRSGMPWRK
jgi:hypothetical protein